MTLTEEQLEVAARKLCEMRGWENPEPIWITLSVAEIQKYLKRNQHQIAAAIAFAVGEK